LDLLSLLDFLLLHSLQLAARLTESLESGVHGRTLFLRVHTLARGLARSFRGFFATWKIVAVEGWLFQG